MNAPPRDLANVCLKKADVQGVLCRRMTQDRRFEKTESRNLFDLSVRMARSEGRISCSDLMVWEESTIDRHDPPLVPALVQMFGRAKEERLGAGHAGCQGPRLRENTASRGKTLAGQGDDGEDVGFDSTILTPIVGTSTLAAEPGVTLLGDGPRCNIQHNGDLNGGMDREPC